MPKSELDKPITFDGKVVAALAAQGLSGYAIADIVKVNQSNIHRYLAKIEQSKDLVARFEKYEEDIAKLALLDKYAFNARVMEDANNRFDGEYGGSPRMTDNAKQGLYGRNEYGIDKGSMKVRLLQGKTTMNIGLHTTLVLAAEAEDKPVDTPTSSDDKK